MFYTLNHDAIIFLDSDEEAGYKTIACDWKEDKIFEVSAPLYHILKAIDSSVSVSDKNLYKLIDSFGSDANSLKKAITDLIERKIIIKHEH